MLVLLVLLDIANPMWLMFPLWIFTYLFQNQLENMLANLSGSVGFVVAGITYGMLIEIFAIVNNLNLLVDVPWSAFEWVDDVVLFVAALA